MGLVYEAQGRYEEALEHYLRVVELAPDSPIGYRNCGDVYQALENYEQALLNYDMVVERAPEIGCAPRGWLYLNLGQYAQARDDLDRAISLNPNDLLARTGRGRLREMQGDYPGALEDYDTVARFLPRDPRIHVSRGSVLMALEAYDRAVAAFDQALGLDPGASGVWVSKAEALRLWAHDLGAQEKFAEALDAAEEGLRLEPENPVAHAVKGAVLSVMGRCGEAVTALDEAIRLDPWYDWAYWEKGKALYWCGDAGGALGAFDSLAQLSAELVPQAAVGQAMALRHLGRTEEAEQALGRALGDPPHGAAAYMGRAYLLYELGAWEDVVADCRRAVELDPERADAHNLLAWVQAEKLGRNLEECTAEAERAVELAAEDATRSNGLDTLGWVWYLRGDLEKARHYLRRAVELSEPDLLKRTHLEVVERQLAGRG